MKTYARVEGGIVIEVIPPMQYDANSPEGVEPPWKEGDEIPIERRYTSQLIDGTISWMVDITNLNPQPVGWWTATKDDAGSWTFAPPTSPEAA